MRPEVEEWVPVPRFLEANKGKIDRNLLYRLISEGSVPTVAQRPSKLRCRARMSCLLVSATLLCHQENRYYGITGFRLLWMTMT